TITERRHNGAAAVPDVGILLGGISLPGASSPETNGRGAVVVVACPVALWVVLGHNALYITVGFAWLFFADDGAAEDEVTIRQDDGPYGYQLAAMLCFVIFADNLLRRIDGHEQMMWFGVSAGKWELILVSGVLCLVCHLLFWSRISPAGNP